MTDSANETPSPDRRRSVRDKWLLAVSAVGVTCFIGCFAAAMAIYPGGTWFDRQASGHSFALNFLCDLMQTRALNGVATPHGSALAQVGLVAMLVALMSFYWQIANFQSPPSRVGRVARAAGILACVLACAVPLVPSDRFREAHIIAVVGAFLPSLVATIAALIVCLRSPGLSRWLRGAAVLTLSAGALNGFGYAYAYLPSIGFEFVPARFVLFSLPVLQRVATLGLIVWVVFVCLHTMRTLRSRDRS